MLESRNGVTNTMSLFHPRPGSTIPPRRLRAAVAVLALVTTGTFAADGSDSLEHCKAYFAHVRAEVTGSTADPFDEVPAAEAAEARAEEEEALAPCVCYMDRLQETAPPDFVSLMKRITLSGEVSPDDLQRLEEPEMLELNEEAASVCGY